MGSAHCTTELRPREWRRRVSIPARVRIGANWDDAQILNISSRGLAMLYSRPLDVGTQIEVRHRDRTVVATVVWRKGSRAGLQSSNAIGVIDWLHSSENAAPSKVSSGEPDRRAAQRPSAAAIAARSRELARFGEYGGIVALGASVAISLAMAATRLLTHSLAEVAAVLHS